MVFLARFHTAFNFQSAVTRASLVLSCVDCKCTCSEILSSSLNSFATKGNLIYFTLSKTILLVKGRPLNLKVKGLTKKLSLKKLSNSFTAKGDSIDFTLSNARQFYSSKGDPLAVKGLTKKLSLNRFYSV